MNRRSFIKTLAASMRRWLNKHGYKVTMVDRRPFGTITMRILEPKNILGRLHSWARTRLQQKTTEPQ